MITLNVGVVVPVGTPPATKSTLPKVYPDPPSETVTVSTFESLLTTIVALPPSPSPMIGTFVYVILAVPRPTPLFVMVQILSWPLASAFSLIGVYVALVNQSSGTGM